MYGRVGRKGPELAGSHTTTKAAHISHRDHPAGRRASISPTGTISSRNECDQLIGETSTMPVVAIA